VLSRKEKRARGQNWRHGQSVENGVFFGKLNLGRVGCLGFLHPGGGGCLGKVKGKKGDGGKRSMVKIAAGEKGNKFADIRQNQMKKGGESWEKTAMQETK